jgi:hypothetical protein
LREFAFVYFKFLGFALAEGLIGSHPIEIVSGGLGGVGKMLSGLKGAVNSGVKYVVRVEETEGVENDAEL